MPIGFDDLVVENFILETRFERGFLYWDNCGKIWKQICEKWPNLVMKKVTPEEAIFAIENEGLQLKFNNAIINLSQNYPPNSLKIFKEIACEAIPLIAKQLEVTVFSRIGNRICYIYPVQDIEKAEATLLETGMINIPESKVSLFKGKLKNPGVSFRIEDEDVGYTFRILTQARTLNIEIPKILKVDASGFKKDVILIDVDYYTKKPTDLSIINFEELINTVQKNLKYNLPKLLGS
jgi:hypothetical protein